jgi:hypothetical protein
VFVMFDTFFETLFPVAQHAVEQPSQMVGHGDDGFWSAKSGSKRRYLAPSALLLIVSRYRSRYVKVPVQKRERFGSPISGGPDSLSLGMHREEKRIAG